MAEDRCREPPHPRQRQQCPRDQREPSEPPCRLSAECIRTTEDPSRQTADPEKREELAANGRKGSGHQQMGGGHSGRRHCDVPGFRPGLLTLMIRSTELTLVERRSTWVITSKTSPITPNDPFGQQGQPLVKTLVKNHLNTLCPSMSPGTFAAFSKFHLNTSKYPNVKVVYYVEGHNFHVEWHWRFGVEMHEKFGQCP
jgi:hypothetical protein